MTKKLSITIIATITLLAALLVVLVACQDDVSPENNEPAETLSFTDFERTVPLPAAEEIQYVEYKFTLTGEYDLAINIDVADYEQILELLCQEDSYIYYGSDTIGLAGGSSRRIWLYTESDSYLLSLGILYCQAEDGYYSLQGEVSSAVISVLSPYTSQAIANYEANNAE